MTADENPFLDDRQVRGIDGLYGRPSRLARRSGALHRARTSGRPVPDVIIALALARVRADLLDAATLGAHSNRSGPAAIADVGCGRGTTTQVLARTFPAAPLLAIDLSAALLREAIRRLHNVGQSAYPVCGDFTALPLQSDSCELLIAAFCLYHATEPATVLHEFARCLTPGGTLVVVVKSLNSYRELDLLVARSGLDPHAGLRPSLYASAHSTNIAVLVADALTVLDVVHEQHTFEFIDYEHVAEYLSTSPKYVVPPAMAGNAARLREALVHAVADEPVHTSSTVTYVVATKR